MAALQRLIVSPVTALIVALGLGVAAAFGFASNPTFGVALLVLALLVLVVAVVEWLRRNGWRLQSPLTRVPKALAGGMDYRLEFSRLQHERQQLQLELTDWGGDRAARKYLKRAYDTLPLLRVDFANNVAHLLYAAYQKPFTDFAVELKELDDGTATVALPAVNREVNLPSDQAIMVQRHLRKLIEDAKNDRTKETGLSPS
jgi:hypothetical protein